MADTHGAPMLAIHHHTLSRVGIWCPVTRSRRTAPREALVDQSRAGVRIT